MKKIIVANWKMNPETKKRARFIFDSICSNIKNIKKSKIVICPPFIYLSQFKPGAILKLGAQNCFWEEKGAFTGEVSPKMLKNLKVEYVILGHSERRINLKETDEMINKKIKTALKFKMKVILCIGETEKERKRGQTFKILKNQLKNCLKNLSSFQSHKDKILIAYEPVWAIGTSRACDEKKAKEVLDFLRKQTGSKILYGGSVNWQNSCLYLKLGFDGLLIGGASLKPKKFLKIIAKIEKFC